MTSHTPASFTPSLTVRLPGWPYSKPEVIKLPQADLKTEIAFLLHILETHPCFCNHSSNQALFLPAFTDVFYKLLYADLWHCMSSSTVGYIFDGHIAGWLAPLGYKLRRATNSTPEHYFEITTRRSPVHF